MENTILDQPFEQEKEYQLASKGKRFANYIIDIISFYIFAILGGVVFALVSPDTAASAFEEVGNPDTSSKLVEQLLGILILLGYYTIMEGAFNGKTVGKYLTKTRALREDGSSLGWDKALIRSLCRLIPFEGFSYLGSNLLGWHDTISKTMVVED
jgi:uncharacterized RDD family membrane protein YckC